MTVRRFLPVLAVAAALLASSIILAPASAETPGAEKPRRPGEIAREAADHLLRRLDELAAAIPRYALPEITDRGDIIIRRKNPPQPDQRPPELMPPTREI